MRTRVSLVAVAIFALLAAAPETSAQRSGRPTPVPVIPVSGVVFDSVRGKPLRDARVTIDADKSTTTDDRGRFHFDSVPAGVRTISVQHATLDTLGFFGISRKAIVASAADEIQVAIPSFATLWHNGCGASKPPSDSGIVYGVVRDSRTGALVGKARLELVWTELALRDVTGSKPVRKEVVERRWTSDTRSADDGTYAFCGVPASTIMRVQASTESGVSGSIELAPTGLRVQRQDLTLGRRGTRSGLVVGYLIDDTGEPFIDARVTLDDSLEAHSEFDGRFVFANVATGSHQLIARYIGATPVRRTIDVMARDTTLVAMTMSKVVTLSTMNIASPERARMLREQYEDRQLSYRHFMYDSTYVGRQSSMANVFQTVPSVRVKRIGLTDFTLLVPDGRSGLCVPGLLVDGAPINDFGQLAAIPPSRVVDVEIYPSAMQIPSEFQRGGIRYRCGLVVVWTKWAFRIP
jgi:carboxypeptidase family protein